VAVYEDLLVLVCLYLLEPFVNDLYRYVLRTLDMSALELILGPYVQYENFLVSYVFP